ncbi:MAG: hypothetical protein ACRD63_07805, partial [Pyrinomonadaceae bacterium]
HQRSMKKVARGKRARAQHLVLMANNQRALAGAREIQLTIVCRRQFSRVPPGRGSSGRRDQGLRTDALAPGYPL